jgi:small subunit ribosomal protein S2
VANGGTVLFVGTKKQAQAPIEREAERCGMYHMTTRWLGGTLTNFETIRRSIRKLAHYEEMEQAGSLDKYSKKEGAKLRKEYAKLHANLRGIKGMERPPEVMFVIDTRRESIAVKEAERLGIPCIGIVDTNCDPDVVSLPVPGNDDAIRALNLFCRVIAEAAIEGKAELDKKQEADRRKMQEEIARKGAMAEAEEAAKEHKAAQAAPAQPEAAAVAAGDEPVAEAASPATNDKE